MTLGQALSGSIAALVLTGAAQIGAGSERALQSVFGDAGLSLIAEADRVELFRLRTVRDEEAVAEYSVVRSSVLGEELVRDFRRQLLDVRTYTQPSGSFIGKLCGESSRASGSDFTIATVERR